MSKLLIYVWILHILLVTRCSCEGHYENVALNKPCRMSSKVNLQNEKNAVNNNTDGIYSTTGNCISTAPGKHVWWEVNLGRPYPVYDITVWAREHPYAERMSHAVITVDGQVCHTFGKIPRSFSREMPVTCRSGVISGSVIRVTRNSSVASDNVLNICEFQVFSCSDEYWGSGCDRQCGQCRDGAPCDKVTGHCDVCEEGFQPPFCKDAALPATKPGQTTAKDALQATPATPIPHTPSSVIATPPVASTPSPTTVNSPAGTVTPSPLEKSTAGTDRFTPKVLVTFAPSAVTKRASLTTSAMIRGHTSSSSTTASKTAAQSSTQYPISSTTPSPQTNKPKFTSPSTTKTTPASITPTPPSTSPALSTSVVRVPASTTSERSVAAACPSYKFGKDCSQSCSPNCDGVCDKDTGHCTCQPGWKPPNCVERCDYGKYGPECSLSCGKCEGGATCDHVTGHCSACSGNFQTPYCTGCRAGVYGTDCTWTCSEHCNSDCDPVNGFCTCKPGWTTPTCTQPCPAGHYGSGCTEYCGQCLHGATCNYTSGQCDRCDKNFKPPFCKECEAGFFGSDCSRRCSENCADGMCDQRTGHCTCKPGWLPPDCLLTVCPEVAASEECSCSNNHWIIAGSVAGNFVVIAVAIVVHLVILRKRRSEARTLNVAKDMTSTDTPGNNIRLYQNIDYTWGQPPAEQHVDDFGDEAAPDYDDLYEAMDGDDMKNEGPKLYENTRSGNVYTNIDSPGFDVKISLPSSPPPPPPPHHHPNNHNYDDLVENSVRPLYDTIDGNS